MLIGMIIGSSILASFTSITGNIWSLLLRVAYVGYVISVLVAGVLILNLIWHMWRGDGDRD
jgi:hypothetical protein